MGWHSGTPLHLLPEGLGKLEKAAKDKLTPTQVPLMSGYLSLSNAPVPNVEDEGKQ